MASITISGMDVSYNKGKSYVIKDMNLTVKDGEFCVFLGPSGCGKSTAMHSIAGLLHPDKGEISIGGTLVTATDKKCFVPPQERNIAMVFQEYALYPNMTVRRNMSFALETQKAPREEIEKRVAKMAAMLGIEQLLDRRPAELSGGQRQRVALGRALVRDPQVFLLDEPLGNLDAKLRDQVRYELKKIQTQLGVTTVYVTHDQTEAMTMADHIVLMKDGRIMQQGTPDDLYGHPNCLFVAGFLGTPQINTLECTVQKTKEGLKLEAEGFSMPVPGSTQEALTPYVGKTVIVGLRPSDLAIAASGEAAVMQGRVDSVEPLGDAFIVYLNVSGRVVVAKVPGGTRTFGDTISIKVENNRIHVFDKETEMRLNA